MVFVVLSALLCSVIFLVPLLAPLLHKSSINANKQENFGIYSISFIISLFLYLIIKNINGTMIDTISDIGINPFGYVITSVFVSLIFSRFEEVRKSPKLTIRKKKYYNITIYVLVFFIFFFLCVTVYLQ